MRNYFAQGTLKYREWMKTLLSQNSLGMSMYFMSQKEGWVFIGTFYVLELLYSDLGPRISWSCWAFSPPSSNLGLMFDSHLIFILFMDDSIVCFSVKSGDWNKQIFTKCLLCTKVFSLKKREYFKSIQNVYKILHLKKCITHSRRPQGILNYFREKKVHIIKM